MLNGYYSKFVGICISTFRLHEESDAIALEQNAALSDAFRKHEQGVTLDQIVLQYQKSLRQSLVDLHSLGYPVISFYIDHPLSSKISNHRHTSLVDTMQILAYITSQLTRSCLQYSNITSEERSGKSVCGSVHMHNLPNMYSMQSVDHRYTIIIMVPHMFYIQVQFLEIILVGGFTRAECVGFQSFTIWRNTIFPFTPFSYKRNTWEHIFCGTHHPFTTIFPGNLVMIDGNLQINNEYASIKLRYSVIDILVSIRFTG